MTEMIVVLTITLIGLGYALFPLIRSLGLDDREPPSEEDYLRIVKEQKAKAEQGLNDLDTERSVGNISEEEYEQLRERYKRQVASAQKQLEQRTPSSSNTSDSPSLDDTDLETTD